MTLIRLPIKRKEYLIDFFYLFAYLYNLSRYCSSLSRSKPHSSYRYMNPGSQGVRSIVRLTSCSSRSQKSQTLRNILRNTDTSSFKPGPLLLISFNSLRKKCEYNTPSPLFQLKMSALSISVKSATNFSLPLFCGMYKISLNDY